MENKIEKYELISLESTDFKVEKFNDLVNDYIYNYFRATSLNEP
jgi:hypothetical protein